MKNKLLILSCALFSLAKIEAAQKGEYGGVVTQSSPTTIHKLHDVSINSHNLTNAPRSRELSVTSTDPYELSEKSEELFNNKKFKEAAEAFIDSAIYGNKDSQATLVDIDYSSLKYFRSENHLSTEELSHDIALKNSLIKYMELRFADLEKHESTSVK